MDLDRAPLQPVRQLRVAVAKLLVRRLRRLERRRQTLLDVRGVLLRLPQLKLQILAPRLLRREPRERIRQAILGGFESFLPLRRVAERGGDLLLGDGQLRRRLGLERLGLGGRLLVRRPRLKPRVGDGTASVERERLPRGRLRRLEPRRRSHRRPGQRLEHPLEVDDEPEAADARGEVHARPRARRRASPFSAAGARRERGLAAGFRRRRGGRAGAARLRPPRGHLVALASPSPLLHRGGLDVHGEAEAERVVRALHEGKVGEGFPLLGLRGERDRGPRGLLGRRPLGGELLGRGLLGRGRRGGFGIGQIGLSFLLRGPPLRLRHPLLRLPPPLQDLLRLGAQLRVAIAAHLYTQ